MGLGWVCGVCMGVCACVSGWGLSGVRVCTRAYKSQREWVYIYVCVFVCESVSDLVGVLNHAIINC